MRNIESVQTLSIPYAADDDALSWFGEMRRVYSSAVRTAYDNAAMWDAKAGESGEATFVEEKSLLALVKQRFGLTMALDAWAYHTATREGVEQRRARPEGKVVFGGRKNLARRAKGLITKDEWKALRLRPLKSLGDKQYHGNRHFRLSEDARTCTVRMYGRSAVIRLPEMHGKRGTLMRAVALLAAKSEINLTFRLGKTLDITFDPMDLRKLPPGVTLAAAKDAVLAAKGQKARGRPRGPNYKPPPLRWSDDNPRPVHPEWAPPVQVRPGRVLALDLNPNWVGLTVVENLGHVRSLDDTRVLAHRLVKFDLPPDAPVEVVGEVLAKVAGVAMALCAEHGAGIVGMEDGLGHLRSSKQGRKRNRLLNAWDRTTLENMISRRGAFRGIVLVKSWCGYSTTIGNIVFPLPDACAAAAEMGRRTLAELDWRARVRAARLDGSLPKGGVEKDLLPFLAETKLIRWMDEAAVAPVARGRLAEAGTWQEIHREAKAAKIGVRRPHPDVSSGADGPRVSAGFAVSRLGHRRRPGLVFRPAPAAQVWRDSHATGRMRAEAPSTSFAR